MINWYETLRAIFVDLVVVASLFKLGGISVAVRMAVSDDDSWEIAAQTALDIHRRVISAVRNRATPSRAPKKVPLVFTYARLPIPLLVLLQHPTPPPKKTPCLSRQTRRPASTESCIVNYDRGAYNYYI